MKGKYISEYGDITIDSKVIATCAGSVAVECFGIVGMAWVNVKDGVVKLLRRDSWSKGISIKFEDNQLVLDFHVIVAYGINIPTVTENLISNVKYKVEALTGFTVSKVNIFVDGVRTID